LLLHLGQKLLHVRLMPRGRHLAGKGAVQKDIKEPPDKVMLGRPGYFKP